MKYITSISLVVLMSLGLYLPINAYAGGPGFDDEVRNWKDDDDWDKDDKADDDDEGNANDIPLDGGLSFLAVAGAAYGIKRVRDNRKK